MNVHHPELSLRTATAASRFEPNSIRKDLISKKMSKKCNKEIKKIQIKKKELNIRLTKINKFTRVHFAAGNIITVFCPGPNDYFLKTLVSVVYGVTCGRSMRTSGFELVPCAGQKSRAAVCCCS